MKRDASVARSVDATLALVPEFERLFAGLESLGSFPGEVVSALRRAGLGRGARVLDLGCGKGAAAIELAREFDGRVLGIDACPAFIAHARRRARGLGVASSCTFRVGDASASRRGFDAAIMLGLFGAERAAPQLRRCVRSGGIYLFDDAFGDDPRTGLPSRHEIRAAITSLGDTIVLERMLPRSRLIAEERRLYARLAANARELACDRPGLAKSLRAFLARQRQARRLLAGPMRCGLWAARKS